MTIASGIAIYFVTWWICLFVVLPWGAHSHHEQGLDVGHGNEAGAPVKPMMWRKIMATTVLSIAVFAVIYGQVNYGWITFDDIPFLRGMPKPV